MVVVIEVFFTRKKKYENTKIFPNRLGAVAVVRQMVVG